MNVRQTTRAKYLIINFFLSWHDNPQWTRHPHCRGFNTTLNGIQKHVTFRTRLDEGSAHRRDLYENSKETDRQTDRQCSRQDCNPQSHEASGHRSTPQAAWPLGSAHLFNLLNPTGHVMHQQFNIQQLYVLPTLYLCVLYLSENIQQLVPLTA